MSRRTRDHLVRLNLCTERKHSYRVLFAFKFQDSCMTNYIKLSFITICSVCKFVHVVGIIFFIFRAVQGRVEWRWLCWVVRKNLFLFPSGRKTKGKMFDQGHQQISQSHHRPFPLSAGKQTGCQCNEQRIYPQEQCNAELHHGEKWTQLFLL